MFYVRDDQGNLHGIKQTNTVGFCEECGELVHVDLPACLESIRLENEGMEMFSIDYCTVVCDGCSPQGTEDSL